MNTHRNALLTPKGQAHKVFRNAPIGPMPHAGGRALGADHWRTTRRSSFNASRRSYASAKDTDTVRTEIFGLWFFVDAVNDAPHPRASR